MLTDKFPLCFPNLQAFITKLWHHECNGFPHWLQVMLTYSHIKSNSLVIVKNKSYLMIYIKIDSLLRTVLRSIPFIKEANLISNSATTTTLI